MEEILHIHIDIFCMCIKSDDKYIAVRATENDKFVHFK